MSSWVCMSPLSGPFNTKGREREREIKPFGKTLLAKSKSCPSPTHLANKCFRATVFSDNRISLEQEPFLSVMSRRSLGIKANSMCKRVKVIAGTKDANQHLPR
ncbi:hypothetical protein P5673_008934 [Acropora cervicornis]|uniref:Uncharacterized protein n=1 Tax=Acropora cervicornis TaxID=6130 RepID=A0AAD9QTM2_ACRCE|nr:hypothetical protein P5673_008934 [Acropora cervicornis]